MKNLLVFPGRQALLQYRRQQGPVHWGHLYTWAGRHSLLQALLNALPQNNLQPLNEMAGIMATAQALQSEKAASPLSGIAGARRLPHKLWRLLLQLKAANITSDKLQALNSPSLQALGRVLAGYQQFKNGLEDESDALKRLLEYIERHGLPGPFTQYQGLEAYAILWLRPLDMRLLAGLRRCLHINLHFALPYVGDQRWLQLTDQTAAALERFEELEISWPDAVVEDEESLSRLVYNMMQGLPGQGRIELHRPAGLYSEVEYLLRSARQAIQQGTPACEIVLVFPDLNLYGQMAEDVAERLGLRLAFRRSQNLSHMPMCRALLKLLRAADNGWMSSDLKKILKNKYLFSFFNKLFQLDNKSPYSNYQQALVPLLEFLERANYVDSYEETLPGQLGNWLKKPGREGKTDYLLMFFKALYNFINDLNTKTSLDNYIQTILFEIIPYLMPEITNYRVNVANLPADTGRLLARDMQTWQEIKSSLEQLEQAGRQVACELKHFDIVDEYFAGRASRENQAGGIMVMRLEDAAGLSPQLLLVGGLNNNLLPSQPEPFVLNSIDQKLLNNIAGMSVWRSRAEEYYGQYLRLNLLLSSTRGSAFCTSPLADSGGQPLRASLYFNHLAKNIPVSQEQAGIFGQAPDLRQAYDRSSLSLALAYHLYGSGDQRALAQAIADKYPELLNAFSPPPRPCPPDLAADELGLLRPLLANIGHLSVSAINEYIECPQKWFFSYLAGLRGRAEVGLDMEISDEGTLVHALLGEYFQPEQYQLITSRRAIKARLEEAWKKLENGQNAHRSILRGRKPLIIERLVQVIDSENQTWNDYRPIAVEYPFIYPGLPPLTGRIDRVDAKPGKIRVSDYKYSGSIRVNEFVPSAESAPNVQLLVYLAALRRQYPELALEARIVGCREGGIYPVLEWEPGNLEDSDGLCQQLAAIWQNIEQGRFAPSSETARCRLCPYNFICRYRDFKYFEENYGAGGTNS